MSTVVMAHDYISASVKIEKAIARMHSSGPNDDAAFHNLVITLVDEACSGVKLYMPMGQAGGKPFRFERQGIPVWMLYTDQRMAEACASACLAASGGMGEMGAFPRAVEQSLQSVIDMQTVGLALNAGLPSQMLLPPNVVHTIAHLCMTRQLKTVEPEGSSWNEWIGIMNRYFEEQEKERIAEEKKNKRFWGLLRKKDKGEPKSIHVEDTELKLPIKEVDAPPQLAIYFGPKPDTRYILY